jgi:hypothetical protein
MTFFYWFNFQHDLYLNETNKDIYIEGGYSTQVSPSTIISIHASMQRMRSTWGACGFTSTLMVTKSPYILTRPFWFSPLSVNCNLLYTPFRLVTNLILCCGRTRIWVVPPTIMLQRAQLLRLIPFRFTGLGYWTTLFYVHELCFGYLQGKIIMKGEQAKFKKEWVLPVSKY